MQVLLDKMKYDPDWYKASTSYDPLQLLALMEKTVLAKTEYQYPFATVYEQECSINGFSKNNLINDQWYERFNIKIDVGSAIGLTLQHQVLLSHVAEESNNKFEYITPEEEKYTWEDAEECCLSYSFLRQRDNLTSLQVTILT